MYSSVRYSLSSVAICVPESPGCLWAEALNPTVTTSFFLSSIQIPPPPTLNMLKKISEGQVKPLKT